MTWGPTDWCTSGLMSWWDLYFVCMASIAYDQDLQIGAVLSGRAHESYNLILLLATALSSPPFQSIAVFPGNLQLGGTTQEFLRLGGTYSLVGTASGVLRLGDLQCAVFRSFSWWAQLQVFDWWDLPHGGASADFTTWGPIYSCGLEVLRHLFS